MGLSQLAWGEGDLCQHLKGGKGNGSQDLCLPGITGALVSLSKMVYAIGLFSSWTWYKGICPLSELWLVLCVLLKEGQIKILC